MNKKVKYNVERLFYDNYRVTTELSEVYAQGEHGLKLYQHKDDEGNFIHTNEEGEYIHSHETGLNIYQNNNGKLEGGRQHDPIYNDETAKKQVYTLGCSWTYGWCLEQEQTFTHLLGDENTAVHNYGAGGCGLDCIVKTLSEIYIPESTRQIFIITIPHLFRRLWFDDDGNIISSWQVPEKFDINDYNNYYNFLHHYEIVNRLVGRDKIIWSCWGGEQYGIEDMIGDKVDVTFEQIDYASDDIHPGPKSNKQYAERLKKIIDKRYEATEISKIV